MGIFTELYIEQEPVFIEGNGQYELEVFAESTRQNYLKSLCGGHSLKGSEKAVLATLHYDNCNPTDKNAIRIVVKGGTVGYLSSEFARLFREKIRLAGQEGVIILCNAKILGGKNAWFFKKSDFSIWLDLPIREL